MLATRRKTLLLGAAAIVTGCGQGGGAGGTTPDDMVLGNPHAPVTLIEYASVTCPICRQFHQNVWEQLKRNYIDTGKVRFIFREFPTHGPQVAVAGFQVARCGGNVTPDQYMTRVSAFFERQDEIDTPLEQGDMAGVQRALVAIGGEMGLSADQVNACIHDPAGAQRDQRLTDLGTRENQVTGTPTLVLNGQTLNELPTYEALARMIDQAAAGAH